MASANWKAYKAAMPGLYRKSGSVYGGAGNAGNFIIRPHSIKRTVEIGPGKAKIIPLVVANPFDNAKNGISLSAQPRIREEDVDVWTTVAVQEGSRVNRMKLDVTITPKVPSADQVITLYSMRGMFSYDDLKADTVYGLDFDGATSRIQFADETSQTGGTKTDIVNAQNSQNPSPELALTIDSYRYGDVIKHFWPSPQKTTMYSGMPVTYERWERIPGKIKRINNGTLYALMVMNATTPQASTEQDTISIVIHEEFNEVPLVQ